MPVNKSTVGNGLAEPLFQKNRKEKHKDQYRSNYNVMTKSWPETFPDHFPVPQRDHLYSAQGFWRKLFYNLVFMKPSYDCSTYYKPPLFLPPGNTLSRKRKKMKNKSILFKYAITIFN